MQADRLFQFNSAALSPFRLPRQPGAHALPNANIAFKTAVLMRNRLVSAHHDIKNKPV